MVGVISYPARKRRIGMDSPKASEDNVKIQYTSFQHRKYESAVMFHINPTKKSFLWTDTLGIVSYLAQVLHP